MVRGNSKAVYWQTIKRCVGGDTTVWLKASTIQWVQVEGEGGRVIEHSVGLHPLILQIWLLLGGFLALKQTVKLRLQTNGGRHGDVYSYFMLFLTFMFLLIEFKVIFSLFCIKFFTYRKWSIFCSVSYLIKPFKGQVVPALLSTY